MKKTSYGLVILSVFIYLVFRGEINLEFLIKCTIIFMSLIIHKQGHKIMKIITTRIKYDNVRDILIDSGGLIANFIIFLIFRGTDFYYSGYIAVINFSLAVVNMLPIYPLDFHNVFKSILRIAIKEEVVCKISGATSWLAISFVFLLGILQMVFFSYNCSVIITCLLLKNYEKLDLEEGAVLD